MDRSALRERQRDSAGANPELERGALTGKVSEEVDRRVDGFRFEHGRMQLVVALGRTSAEEVLGHL